jgi:hypothetical protein
VAQQAQLGRDPRRAPRRVLPRHPTQQGAHLPGQGQPARNTAVRLPAPEQPEALPVPAEASCWLGDGQPGAPGAEAVGTAPPRTGGRAGGTAAAAPSAAGAPAAGGVRGSRPPGGRGGRGASRSRRSATTCRRARPNTSPPPA